MKHQEWKTRDYVIMTAIASLWIIALIVIAILNNSPKNATKRGGSSSNDGADQANTTIILYPEEGAPESTVTESYCGNYSSTKPGPDPGSTLYYWYAKDGSLVMYVLCRDGVISRVSRVNVEKYWASNGFPLFEWGPEPQPSSFTVPPVNNSSSTSTSKPSSSTDRYNVQDFNDPDDFASYWMEEFLEDDDADDDEEALDEAYNDAWDYWWEHHK